MLQPRTNEDILRFGRIPHHFGPFGELNRNDRLDSTSSTSNESSFTLPSTITAIDPLVSSMIEGSNGQVEIGDFMSEKISLFEASAGIGVWRRTLLRGRLPLVQDFLPLQQPWPVEPLFSALSDSMAHLQLPRFVLRHPETINSVLLTLLRLTMEFQKQKISNLDESDIQQLDDDEGDHEDKEEEDIYLKSLLLEMENDNRIDPGFGGALLTKSDEEIAQEVATGLVEEYREVLQGVQVLDHIFGMAHGLLKTERSIEGAAGVAFGLQDGIWQHTGWKVLNELQRELAAMTELRTMVKSLGRRPASQGVNYHRFSPRKLHRDGGLGAQLDPFTRSTVTGLTLSNSLSEMLPSEAVLLKGSPALRKLFMAKRVESKLLSYELSGWSDVPSVPRLRPRYFPRMPSAPGGPIIVCLDTSWSMSGRREVLSKAVVLACVSEAHKQRRECQVVAFSNKRGVMDCGRITADVQGVRRLLDFLSFSFGGGTDVTGALQHVMRTQESEALSGSDILLVTDGEIPDPPISDVILKDLDLLKRRTGLEIHGLLVGKAESKPLSKLCTQIYDFLGHFDMPLEKFSDVTKSRTRSTTTFSAFSNQNMPSRSLRPFQNFENHVTTPRRYGWSLRYNLRCSGSRIHLAARSASSDTGGRQAKKGKANRKYEDDEDNSYWGETYLGSDDESIDLNQENEISPVHAEFYKRVEDAVVKIQDATNARIADDEWRPKRLDEEKDSKNSGWKYRDQLKFAVETVGENLIERSEEARLVVLGMVSSEHVLLLGPPGTAKSELGRRLSKLCGGPFFQRLLTRFTTPEEIFGPLSLRALENDEYKRCTEGFLPTASVAFLDEIFKANSNILNTLLTVLNERQFDNGAGVRELCPIKCVVGASNELPESDELDAIYDRFLLRKEVLPVSDEGIIDMLKMSTPGASRCDTTRDKHLSSCETVFDDGLENVIECLSEAASLVHMSDDACAMMRDLRKFMKDEVGVDVSDRRIVKAARLLRFSAASHGRTRVDPIDCLLLQHIVWKLPEQRSTVRDWLWDHITPGGEPTDGSTPSIARQLRLLLDGLCIELLELLRKTSGDITGESGGRDADIALIRGLSTEISRIASLLQGRRELLERHSELLRRSIDHLWLDPEEARAAQQLLLPKAEVALMEVKNVLAQARMLELVLGYDFANYLSNDLRQAAIERLWEDNDPAIERSFTEYELNLTMKDAKAKYDLNDFRAWKRARKKMSRT